MTDIIMWVSIGILGLFLLIGLISGLIRGLKRSSLHLLFLVISFVVAFFITKPVTTAILGIKIPVDGQEYTISEFIISSIQSNFDITQLESATEFLKKLPNAIVSPIMFILLALVVFFIFDIIYLIVARLSFGKKKEDFKKAKPYRAYGGVIGLVEGFLFLFVLFAPLTALTKTYQEIAQLPPAETQTQTIVVNANEETGDGTTQTEPQKMKSIAETLKDMIPVEVSEAIFAYNDSVVGKIAGAGGLDNALFDGLSNFEMDGEKIKFRKEILDATDVYDEFVVVYNSAIDKNYVSIDLTDLKSKLETFLDNGLFKTVISDTVNEIVVKFDTLKDQFNFENIPQVVQDIINDLQVRFSTEGFDTYEYLKHDIMSLVDVADKIFKNDLISQFESLQSGEDMIVEVLNLVDRNSLAIKDIAQDILNLNLVTDTFDTLGKLASEKISESMKNDQGLEIALNTNIEDKQQMIDDVLKVVDDFISINEKVDISAMMKAEDIIGYLTSIDDLDGVLTQLGSTLDSIRNLEILVLPADGETRPNDVYVVDNILTLYNFNLLGDEVYLTPEDETTTKLDNYTKLLSFIKTPILELQKLNITNIGENMDFDVLLNGLLTGLETNNDLLSDILLPIYQLEVMNLNDIFNQIVDQIGSEENTNGMINLTKVKEEASTAPKNGVMVWDEELGYIGEVLISLNKGSVGTENETYLEALLSGTTDIKDIMNAMIDDGTISATLNPVFTARSFEGLTNQIFDMIDEAINGITGVKPNTVNNLGNLKNEKDEVISIITSLLDIVTNDGELTLKQLGNILDQLKVNAYNDGAKNGVFNEIFANLIWYITGDNLTENSSYDVEPANDFYKDVKAYLNIEDVNGYYTYESYEATMEELDGVINFATTLSETITGKELTLENAAEFVESIKTAIDASATTEDSQVELLNNVAKILTGNPDRGSLLTEDQMQYKEAIVAGIDQTYGEGNAVGTALKSLLGLN